MRRSARIQQLQRALLRPSAASIRIWAGLLVATFTGCRTAPAPVAPFDAPPELGLTLLTLPDALTDASLEFSALAYWPDHGVVMVPQYPDRFGDRLWLLPRAQLADIQNGATAVDPQPLAVRGLDAATALPGYEGFEAIALGPDSTAAVLIEHRHQDRTIATLLQGRLTESGFVLGSGCSATLQPPTDEHNQSFEALLWDTASARWVAMPELNGPPLVQNPRFTAVDPITCQTSDVDTVPVPWRITDVCSADGLANEFTTINYFWDGDRNLAVDVDPLAHLGLMGATHQSAAHRERLVQWSRQVSQDGSGPAWTPTEAHWLELGPRARNWEGIACLENGWLLVTDRHPGTLLAFVGRSGRP